MNSIFRTLCFVLIVFSAVMPSFADEKPVNDDSQVIFAFQVKRTANFLKEPGNNPIEILRRLGRVLNIQLSSDDAIYASVFEKKQMGHPEFLKPVSFESLTDAQKDEARNILKDYDSELKELVNECHPASEALIISAAAKSLVVRNTLCSQLELAKKQNASGTAQTSEFARLKRLNDEVMPIAEASDCVIAALVISENGCFGQLKVLSEGGKLLKDKSEHDISIDRYINDSYLMSFCQTHPIEDPKAVYNEIASMPQSAMVLNMLASAGLDLEKDILCNSARETILYVNLEPDQKSGVPEIVFAAPIPDVNKLVADMPKYKNLCVLSGIFAAPEAGVFPTVRLSHFMLPSVFIYAGIVDRFLVISTSKESVIKEMTHISDVSSEKENSFKLPGKFKRYWQIHTEDFNRQFQMFLQSPLVRNRGIPPISNLTFVKDFDNVLVTTSAAPEKLSFTISLPLKKK